MANYSTQNAQQRANKRKRKHFKDHSEDALRQRERADKEHERWKKAPSTIKAKRAAAPPYLRVYYSFVAFPGGGSDHIRNQDSIRAIGDVTPQDTEFGSKLANVVAAAKKLAIQMGRKSVKIDGWAWIIQGETIQLNMIEAK